MTTKMMKVMKEVPLYPAVYRTWDSRIFLKVLEVGPKVIGLGITTSKDLGVLGIPKEEFKKFYKLMDHITVGHAINRWMEFRKYIPISPKVEEVLMAIMAFDKNYSPVGKFATLEDAVESCPRGGLVINSDGELEGLTLSELTTIYNALVKPEKRIKKFENKEIGVSRTSALIEGYENTAERKPKPKPKEKKMNTGRDKMREFLTEGKIFSIEDIAALLGTNRSNASTGVNLLKTRPGKGFQALVTEKTEDGKLKVVQAPCAIEPEEKTE